MSGIEIAGLVLGAMGLVTVFKEGYKLVQAHRQRRRIRILGFGAADTTVLANEISNSESSIVTQYHKFHDVYGDTFAQGDGIARERLKDLIIQLQHELILALQNGNKTGKISNPSRLVTVTITGRTDASLALTQLAQRLAITLPLGRTPNLYNLPNNPSTAVLPLRAPSQLFLESRSRKLGVKSSGTEIVPQRNTTELLEEYHEREVDPRLYKTTMEIIKKSHKQQALSPQARATLSHFEPPQKKTLSPQALAARRAKSTSLGRLGCDLCQRKFERERDLKNHLASPGHNHKERDALRYAGLV